MRILRRTTTIDAVQAILCWLLAQYIRIAWYTGRWQVVGAEGPIAHFESGKPLIIATWHGRLLMTPFGWRHSNRTHILVSAHNDGRLISRTLAHFNAQTITGSTRRGGADALRRLHKVLRDGGAVGITPDGPRGPRMRVSPGIVQLARLNGAPIFPLAFAARPSHIFDSWDRFVLPLPFCRGLYLWGDPIEIARDTDKSQMEEVRLDLEEKLNALTRKADTDMGLKSVNPAPAPPVANDAAAS